MIVIGIDPALDGMHAQVCCHLGDVLSVVDARGETHLANPQNQLALLEPFVAQYKPSVVILEFNAAQAGLGRDERLLQMGRVHGFSIHPHYTTAESRHINDIFGPAGMDRSFKKGEIRFPYADQHSRDRMQPLITQLRSFRPDIPKKRQTVDLVDALWFVWRYWQKRLTQQYELPPEPSSRPSWSPRNLTPAQIFTKRAV